MFGEDRVRAVQQGIRQDCPISGQLYSFSVEPLLCKLRDLSGLFLPGSSDLGHPLTVSAYADDVSVFITDQGGVQCLQDTLCLYEKASTAWVNWAKSEALLVGHWRDQAAPSLPRGLKWGKEGLKVLGVFLGTEGFQGKNWEDIQRAMVDFFWSGKHWVWAAALYLPVAEEQGLINIQSKITFFRLWKGCCMPLAQVGSVQLVYC